MSQMTLSLRYAALSDVGRVRKDNQDSGFASERLLVVADGVGGAARGDIASSTAVEMLRRLDTPPSGDLLEAVAGAIHRAHDRIAELVDEDRELEGTSTTVTAALFDGNRIGVGHVGDSRGYLLRDGALTQLTRDHTFVQSLIDEGRITEEESRVHPHRNLILRAVDGVHDTDPDLFLVDLAPGDRLLLCSDGASGVLDHERLTDILSTGTVDFAAVELVRASLDAGSTDNVTCVVADVVDSQDAADSDTVAAASTGPMLVGAAADQPRRPGGAKGFFLGHRGGDTGELEPVPGEEEPVDPEVLRYAPRPPRRFIWVRRLALLVAVGLVLLAVATFGYRWTQDQYYVAAADESVAIYQGVQADIPGLRLTSVYEETDIPLGSLSEFRASTVRGGLMADDLEDARAIVSRLEELAKVCPEPDDGTGPGSDGDSGATDTGSPDASLGDASSVSPDGPPAVEPSPTGSSADGSAGGSAGEPSPDTSPSPRLAPPDCMEVAR